MSTWVFYVGGEVDPVGPRPIPVGGQHRLPELGRASANIFISFEVPDLMDSAINNIQAVVNSNRPKHQNV